MSTEEIILVYDKECPACDNYCRVVRVRESIGQLKIVNARDDSEIMKDITKQGLDIDQGMVLKMGDKYYYGSYAIHMLAQISSHSNFINRLNYWFLKSKTRACIFYPILRFFRNLLLKILGKSKINNLEIENNAKF